MQQIVTHRQRSQAILMAALSMMAVIGGLAIVIDIGMFMVIQRQLQSAADAGALAGAWYDPICPDDHTAARPVFTPAGCRQAPPQAIPQPLNTSSPCDPFDSTIPQPCAPCQSGYPTCDVAMANGKSTAQLCGGAIHVTVSAGTQLIVPKQVNTIVVIAECDAGYSFGRIFNLSAKRVTASAAAAIGTWTGGGDIGDMPPSCTMPHTPPCLIARLLQ